MINPLEKDSDYLYNKFKNNEEPLRLAIDYQQKGQSLMVVDNLKALEYLEKSLKIYTDTIKLRNYSLANLHSLIGTVYYSLGRREEAFKKAILAKNMFQEFDKRDWNFSNEEQQNTRHHNLANEYLRLGDYYLSKKSFKNYKENYKNHINTLKKITSTYSDIANIYESMAKYYLRYNNLDLSLKYNQKALKEYHKREEVYKKQKFDNPQTASYAHMQQDYQRRVIIKIYASISMIYQKQNKQKERLINIENAIKWGEKLLRKYDILLVNLYYLASEAYLENKIFDMAYDYSKQAFDSKKYFRDNNFKILNNNEKYDSLHNIEYIRFMPQLLFTTYQYLQYTIMNNQYERMVYILKNTFNTVINYKGEISNFNNIISIIEAKTDNQELRNSITKLKNLKIELSNEYQKFQEENISIERIKKQISEIEINLSNKSQDFKEFLEIKTISYHDISSCINSNQLYIDFIKTDYFYYTLILDSMGNLSINQIPDTLENKIKDFIFYIKVKSTDIKYRAKEIYDILGFKHLKAYNELIISPDGLLNLLPFEALYDGERYLTETKTISYMSSAKEFVRGLKRKKINNISNIVAFGDANFDMKFDIETRGIPSLLTEKFGDLPATKDEIEAISKIYPNTKVYTKDKATVENLLSIKNPKILHLATHGFYLKDEDTDPLEKAGLAFSGAKRASKVGDTRGIITALKISTMDLNYTELVVLSACKSGLGDINNSDGVMNLPSAFIQAGARSVIMSLWKIDDKETSILIQDFYDNISKGKTYRKALREAKLKMIDKNPFYWSSLIISGI